MSRILIILCVFLCCSCEESPEDATCEEGAGECMSLYEVRYCLDGVWGDTQDCPPVTNGEFEVTTVCDEGLCRP